jgi:hypothetical protein
VQRLPPPSIFGDRQSFAIGLLHDVSGLLPVLDQSRRAEWGPLSLWQRLESSTVPNGIVHCYG